MARFTDGCFSELSVTSLLELMRDTKNTRQDICPPSEIVTPTFHVQLERNSKELPL